ncbi:MULTISPECIES: DotA/TraY family protein [unclassified Aureimonas]|uniref:DotA/TraY family protein n=1 Tax=unclassified Aureimonas TaxID=2615206 RepID=UPI0006F39047|nr:MULTISPECIES: DotA/TraY family protein [unclassified Aureimonas]KQT64156.1 hypothetical protein ASG62_03935 [Aureimonas sp. Leaf427]KQT81345.1 hypothetical protein ASG54_01205 [Aureimonas sp. Leaf460]
MDLTPFDVLARLPADDWSSRVLETLLPTDGTTTAFSAVLHVAAAGLVFIGSLWLGYMLLSEIVRAAREGKTLAEGTSGAWAILRPVVGMGVLIPIAGLGGLAVVHVLLKEVSIAGTNLGNAAAVRAVGLAAIEGKSPLPVSGGGRSLVSAVLESEVCALTHAAAAERSMADGSAARQTTPAGIPIRSDEETSWWTGEVTAPARTTGWSWDYGPACGAFTLTNPAGFESFGETRRAAVEGLVGTVRGFGVADALARHFGAVVNLPSGFDPATVGQELVAHWKAQGVVLADVVQRIHSVGDGFDRAMMSAAEEEVRTDDTTLRQQLLDRVTACGWPCIGEQYRILGRINAAAQDAASERIVRTRPDESAWGTLAAPVRSALALLRSQLLVETTLVSLTSSDLATEAEKDAESTFVKIGRAATEPMHQYLSGYDGYRPDPVTDLMSVGNRLLVGAQISFGVGAAATGAANFFSSAAGETLSYLMQAGFPLIVAAWAAGALLVYVLPLVPWIFVTYAFAAWCVEVMVAAIAVLIWAFGHLRLDGGSFVDRAQTFGYGSLLVSILMRPIATVAAYVAASSLTAVLLNFVSYSFAFASTGAVVGFGMGITGIVVYALLNVFVAFSVFLFVFKATLSIPERLGQWLGVQGSGWGEGEAGNTVVMGAAGGGRRAEALAGGMKPSAGKAKGGEDDGGGDVGAKAGNGLRARPGGSREA